MREEDQLQRLLMEAYNACAITAEAYEAHEAAAAIRRMAFDIKVVRKDDGDFNASMPAKRQS